MRLARLALAFLGLLVLGPSVGGAQNGLAAWLANNGETWLFYRKADSSVVARTASLQNVLGPEIRIATPGATASDPAVVGYTDASGGGRVMVIFYNARGWLIYMSSSDGKNWTEPMRLGGASWIGSPSATFAGGGVNRIFLATQDPSGVAWVTWSGPNGGWAGRSIRGTRFKSGPSIAYNDGRIHMIGTDASNNVAQQYFSVRSWAGPGTDTATASIPAVIMPAGQSPASPFAFSRPRNAQLHAIVQGTDNGVYLNTQSLSPDWDAWLSLKGGTIGRPAAVTWREGMPGPKPYEIRVFVRGTDGAIWNATSMSATDEVWAWSAWVKLN